MIGMQTIQKPYKVFLTTYAGLISYYKSQQVFASDP